MSAGKDAIRIADVLVLEDYLLLGAVVGLPWAFGGVETWAHRTAALLLAAAAAAAVVKRGWDALGLGRRSRWLLPALLLGLWAAVQLVPLPGAVLRRVSPQAHALYAATFPGYAGPVEGSVPAAIEARALERVPEAKVVAEPDRPQIPFDPRVGGRFGGWRAISLHPAAGLERVFWYFALFLGFLVARRRVADPDVAEAYHKVLFVLFFLLASFGLLYAATSNGKLYWVRDTLYRATPFGPYVNPTNFAAVMELAVPWLAGYTVLAWKRNAPSSPFRESRVPFLAAATATSLLAALATASKAGAALVLLSLAVLAFSVARDWRQRLAAAAGLAVLATAFAAALYALPLGDRIRELVEATGGQVSEVDRVVAWRASAGMARDYPVTGVGFGALPDAFGAYLPAGESKRWEHMHNDYLEVALEGGAVALALLPWLAWGFWRRAWSGAGIGLAGGSNPAAVGLLLGLLALSVHAFLDFNHQIPANALLFTTAGAVAVARGERSVGERTP